MDDDTDDDTDDGDKSEANEEELVINEADDETTGVADDETTGVADDEITGVADETPINTTDDMDQRYGPRTRENLRPRRPRDYDHLHPMFGTVMTQYHVNKGLKEFGVRGTEAVLAELKQLHVRKVIVPRSVNELTQEEKHASLPYIMFLKEKRCGTVKGRGCADGRKQRLHTTKEDSSSPTVATEALFLSCVIDAKEGRDVATVDIPGAFMHADMDEKVHIRIEGEMAKLLAKLDPNVYRKFVAVENGKLVLYAELSKALYGTLRAALLFWRLLSKLLKSWGFVINPYDWCVANKMIDGKQCTILWHVDDLKISHVSADVVTRIIQQLDDRFGKEAPITVTRGKKHDYLGMELDFSKPGCVIISMFKYINTMLDELPTEFEGHAPTPAAENLFEVRPDEERTLLNKELSGIYHHFSAKLLFLSQRARPDVQPAVSFLTTRVKSPDEDDYKKLGRCMRYIRSSMDIPLTLEADSLHVIKWYVDSSYAVHPDMRSHTGAVLTFGKGAVYNKSRKQKLNTRSSTEAELVGTDDAMGQVLWTRYFMQAQGYDIHDNILFQDNQSSMRLEQNGRASSTKRTKHIDVRYFFIADRVASKEIRIVYCPTDEMWADFHTKPLQGYKFIYFRNLLLNCKVGADVIPDTIVDEFPSPQECVED